MSEDKVIKKGEIKNKKNRSGLIIAILVALIILLLGILIYVLFFKKAPVKDNIQQNTNEIATVNVNNVSRELVELISDFGGVMLLNTKGDTPASYTVNDLSKENNSNIILMYALQNIGEKDNDICKYSKNYDSECYIKVSDLNTKLGLNIGNNIKTNEYVKGVVKKDNEDYYKVMYPATEWGAEYYVRDCNTSNTNEKLTIKCDVYQVIEMYDPYEEAKVGIGEFIYNITDKLSFEKFVYKALSTSTMKQDTKKAKEPEATEYKTSDGKYTLKISNDGKKVYLNNRELVESDRKEDSKYMQIWGEFSESFNYIAGLTFVLDKEKKVIVDQTIISPAGQEDKDGLGEYARFSSRSGFSFANINEHHFFVLESEFSIDVYTTNFKKVGYDFGTPNDIKYDSSGIYLCGDAEGERSLDDLKCHNQVKYDYNGNRIEEN